MRLANKAKLLLALLLSSSFVQAQGAAAGNLYKETLYEVEVSIFSNRSSSTVFTETLNPATTILEYPSRLDLLQLPREPLAFDFSRQAPDQDIEQPLVPQGLSIAAASRTELENTVETNDFGPPYTPATDSFQLPFNEGNNYMPLGGSSDNFARYNQRLRNTSQYTLLWHGRWRQPIDNALQGIALSAGDLFGEHHQLQGWIGISQSGANITAEVDVWLADFEQVVNPTPGLSYLDREIGPYNTHTGREAEAGTSGEKEQANAPQYWVLPPSPIAVPKIQEAEHTVQADFSSPLPQPDIQWQATHVDVLREIRPMSINTLNYLDHPAFGVLVEVRPYEPEIAEEALQ